MRGVQDVYDSWREAIASALDQSGHNRAWLAARCEVADSTIKRVLDGGIVPSDSLKWRIAGALGKRVDELFRFPNVIPSCDWLDETVPS